MIRRKRFDDDDGIDAMDIFGAVNEAFHDTFNNEDVDRIPLKKSRTPEEQTRIKALIESDQRTISPELAQRIRELNEERQEFHSSHPHKISKRDLDRSDESMAFYTENPYYTEKHYLRKKKSSKPKKRKVTKARKPTCKCK
jgi:hypothetical protein